MGTVCRLEKMRKFWRCRWQWPHSRVNVPDAILQVEMVKMDLTLYIFYYNKNINLDLIV